MEYKLQKIGALLWVISLVLLFLSTQAEVITPGISAILTVPAAWPCYLLLIAVLVIDIILVKKKEPTITEWYRKKLPKLADTIITVVVVALFIWYHTPIIGLYMLQGTINGHLNWNW